MTDPTRFFLTLEPDTFAPPCPDPCHGWPYVFTACHGWPYDGAFCRTCTDSRLRAYQILDAVEIRPTHPVTPIHGATATVVALTSYSALVEFHNRAHGILYGSLGIFLEIENLHLQHLEIPESSRPLISDPLQEEPQS